MFVHTLHYARQSRLFDEIIVSTEAEWVRDLCLQEAVEIPFLRPAELAGDGAQLVDVCRHVLEEYERRGKTFDRFCLLWATAPMRTDEDIRKAYDQLDEEADAVVGVTEYARPVFCAQCVEDGNRLRPLFPDMLRLPRTRMPPVVVDNGSLCWVKVQAFWEQGTWLPARLKGYPMPRRFSLDIETEEDWDLAEFYFEKYFRGSSTGRRG